MTLKRLLPTVFAIGLLVAFAGARDQPRLAVQFGLEVPLYQSNFRTDPAPGEARSEYEEFQHTVAQRLHEALEKEIGFVDFVAATETTEHLRIALVKEDTPSETVAETYFELSLEGPPTARGEPVRWLFREAESYQRAVDPAQFPDEIVNAFGARLRTRLNELVLNLLSQYPVATDALLIRNADPLNPDLVTFYCALPISYQDLEAGVATAFRIETRSGALISVPRKHFARGIEIKPGDIESMPEAFRAGLLAEEYAPPAFAPEHTALEHLFQNPSSEVFLQVPVKGVYVVDYRHRPTVATAPTPSQLNLPE